MSGLEDTEPSQNQPQKPHPGHNPIPTVQQYREFKHKQRQELGYENERGAPIPRVSQGAEDGYSTVGSAATQAQWRGRSGKDQEQPNRGTAEQDEDREKRREREELAQDTSQSHVQGTSDPRQRRKQMKHSSASRVEREVTDPVTHLPVKIHDFTTEDMKDVEIEGRDDDGDGIEDDEDPDVSLSDKRDSRRTSSSMEQASRTQDREHRELYHRFPPPNFNKARGELMRIHKKAAILLVASMVTIATIILTVELLVPDHVLTLDHKLDPRYVLAAEFLVGLLLVTTSMSVVSSWSQNQVGAIWEDAVWHAQKVQSQKALHSSPKETTLWLTKLIGSIWPIINPDLFTGLSDTLEDVMQASLPRMVRMVSVEDIGQGSEPIRILGVRWLPKGAASRSVNENNHSESLASNKVSDSETTGDARNKGRSEERDAQDDTRETKEDRSAEGDTDEGMEAEEGEFVNMEIAFAYRASRFQKKMHQRVKNAHLLLAFYLPGNIKLPVWVELHGVVGWCRVRLQLTPDPPFVALCTMTFLGQPNIDMTCVPLIKSGLNIMGLPLISNFVQSSIDAALSEYVAPKSISLDLQEMLAGSDFKKDTIARGILVVNVKRAYDFKASDVGVPLVGKEKSSDAYVSVGWAKFGKPLWSTRVITADMHPWWKETAYLLVGPEELDAEESLRVQLWDSDKYSADDDLGRIELDLKDLMRNKDSNGKMRDRLDPFKALEAGKGMPGRLEWSVGYFSKVRLLESQLEEQNKDPNVKTLEDLKQKSYEDSERKLREAAKDESGELEQLKEDDWVNTQVDMISSSLPTDEFPSGILSVQVHQIVALQVENVRKNKSPEEEGEEDSGERELPDSYCSIVLNDQKIFKTRTKPKNSSPFFNACTERFIRDWRNTTVMLSVRDQRVHEDDPLLGHVFLDLGDLFRKNKTSRVSSFYPLAGGIGYGRLRVSIVFRSVQMHVQPQNLGWDLGVLEVAPEISATEGLSKDIASHRIRLRTNVSSGRMRSMKLQDREQGKEPHTAAKWSSTRHQPLLLGVRKRHASNLMLEFHKSTSGLLPKSSKVLAFSTAWLKDIIDEEWNELTLPVYTNDNGLQARASANVLPEEELKEFKCGELRVKIRFWRGLGKPHAKLAKKNRDIADVMDVKDAARELGDCPTMVGLTGWREERHVAGDDDIMSDDVTDDESSESGGSDPAEVTPVETEGRSGDGEHEVMSKVGQMAQTMRKKMPFTKVNDTSKQGVNGRPLAAYAADGENAKQDDKGTEAGQREESSYPSAEADRGSEAHEEQSASTTADHSTIKNSDLNTQRGLGSLAAHEKSNVEPETLVNEESSDAAKSADVAEDHSTEAPFTPASTREGSSEVPGESTNLTRPSPSSRQSSAPGTPTHSRPTTAMTSSTSNNPSTPQTTNTTEASPTPSSAPRSQSKRSSGVFSNIKRSFSLRSSPLGRSESKLQKKRSSRVYSDNTENESRVSASSRPTSMAYGRSPLASHPTGGSTTSTPSKHASAAADIARSERADTPTSTAEVSTEAADASEDNGDNENNATRGQMHRRHRGIMQLKGPRTAKWLQHKAEEGIGKVEGVFEHGEREPGVETEV